MRIVSAAALAGALLAGAPALADEAWTSNTGTVIYESEIDGYAVLSLNHPAGQRTIYIADLAENYDARTGYFTGYWVTAAQDVAPKAHDACPVTILAADGDAYDTWGQVMIEFTSPGFPTGFVGATGQCFDPPTDDWNATPQ
tara:strand:- start:796 stop:1221 length:426 start_codon:yes stop_codon:yes gene_type:complete